MKKLIKVVMLIMIFNALALANVTMFENDATSWQAASIVKGTIDWDDVSVADGTWTTISGNHYSSLDGSPQLSVDSKSGLYVMNPDSSYFGADFIPVSGNNVFAPDNSGSPQGILTITFNETMYSLGAWFLDVEQDYLGTGIEIGGILYSFSGNQGDDSQSFLGIVSSTGFTTAKIHMSSINSINGVGIDDVMYGYQVPVPGAVLLGGIGISLVGWMRRRKTL